MQLPSMLEFDKKALGIPKFAGCAVRFLSLRTRDA
jgi:hypothetical protein